MTTAALAGVLFVLTIGAVIARPRGLPEAVTAAAGGLLMVALGVVRPGAAGAALGGQWNLFLFFLGLMLISGLADAAGLFDAAGVLAAAAARGHPRRLLLAVMGTGAVVTAFLSNDATVLILTPVVYAVVRRLRLPPLPYLFATTFVANTASLLLPVSNPVNLLVVGRTGLGLGGYAAHLLPAALAALAVNAILFLAVFGRRLGERFELDWRRALAEAAPDRALLGLTSGALGVVVVAYLAASAVAAPLGPVAIAGALLLGAVAAARGTLRPRRLREHVSLSLFIYVAGLVVVAQGVESAGLAGLLARGLAGLANGPAAAALVGVLGGAAGANLVNNVPATLVLLAGSGHVAAGLRLPFLAGVLTGADLGPNLTPVGSLSTMLWLVIVRRGGARVSALDYLKLGLLVTPAVLLAAALVLAATFQG